MLAFHGCLPIWAMTTYSERKRIWRQLRSCSNLLETGCGAAILKPSVREELK